MFDFSAHLKNLRLSKKLTQKQLAENLNVTEHCIQHYERGSRKPTYDMMISLADYFDVSLDYLTGRTANPKSHTITADMQRDYENTIGRLLQVAKDNPESRERMEKVLDKIIDMAALQIE